MKKWLKENWFKVGILSILLIGAGSISYYYTIILPHKESLLTSTNQISSTATTTVSATSFPVVVNELAAQATEDPTLKIAQCKSEADIESQKEISRYNSATVQDLLACSVNSQCNATSLASALKTVADNKGQATYENMYNLCLHVSQTAFNNVIQTYNGYWAQCTASNPTPNDADTSGTEGMNTYSARVNCVNNFESTKGL